MTFFDRFMYWSPKTLTHPFRPSVFRGDDEWHNRSIAVILPFVGGFIFFWERDFQRSGPEHLYGSGPDGEDGIYVIDCEICREIRREFAR